MQKNCVTALRLLRGGRITMIDFMESFYFGDPTLTEGYDREKAKHKAFSVIVPMIMNNELTEKQSICIRYKYLLGKNQAEIAQILNLSQPTVSRHINAGKDIINNSLKYCYLALNQAIDEYDRLQN